ncbi:uncharacterized protein LOC110349554 [Heterocephalus glaber]|uniref:Uncharacterized protein LOC110349554 n=1 Tax=Heterocephalus glaber TaxID=10181 RepID=A0AAX6T2P7_HETGA|nr:uncharacterized protein LOC110349554 [Heterocephalus glaber]
MSPGGCRCRSVVERLANLCEAWAPSSEGASGKPRQASPRGTLTERPPVLWQQPASQTRGSARVSTAVVRPQERDSFLRAQRRVTQPFRTSRPRPGGGRSSTWPSRRRQHSVLPSSLLPSPPRLPSAHKVYCCSLRLPGNKTASIRISAWEGFIQVPRSEQEGTGDAAGSQVGPTWPAPKDAAGWGGGSLSHQTPSGLFRSVGQAPREVAQEVTRRPGPASVSGSLLSVPQFPSCLCLCVSLPGSPTVRLWRWGLGWFGPKRGFTPGPGRASRIRRPCPCPEQQRLPGVGVTSAPQMPPPLRTPAPSPQPLPSSAPWLRGGVGIGRAGPGKAPGLLWLFLDTSPREGPTHGEQKSWA